MAVPEPMVRAAQEPHTGRPYVPRWPSIGHLLADRAAEQPGETYLIAYDRDGGRHEYTLADFSARVRQFAAYLVRRGIGKGDRIATILYNHHEAVFLLFAAWHLGACVVPINTEEPPERKRYILRHTGVRLLFTLPEYLPEVQESAAKLPDLQGIVVVGGPGHRDTPDLAEDLTRHLPPEHPADAPVTADATDEALIVFTSGTTGYPKGVVLSQYNLLADADAIAHWFRIRPGERWMCVLPIHHVNGIIVTLLSPLYAGGGVILNYRFSPRTFWHRAAAEDVRVVSLVPTLLEFLLEAWPDPAAVPPHRLRGVICGSGPLSVETVLRFEERFGIPVWHGYGLSETTAYACMTPIDLPDSERRRWYSEHGFPTIGTAMPHQELSIRGPDGAALPPGERGEICIRGSTIMQGYFRWPEANAEAFRFPGWFRSGDQGFWLPGPGGRPFFFITGRYKELIIRGGVNLSPLEIDAAIASHPAVQFGMAVPFENRWYGEEVAAYVVPREGVTPTPELAAAIQDHCRRRLPFSMQPKVVLFGTDVPYTSTGKPQRLVLKERLAPELAQYREVQFREERWHER